MKRSIKKKPVFFTVLSFIFIGVGMGEIRAVDSFLDLNKTWTGDYDHMVDRHLIRALVPFSKTFYFLDGATQRGLTYEKLKGFETYINQKLGKKTVKVVPLPCSDSTVIVPMCSCTTW